MNLANTAPGPVPWGGAPPLALPASAFVSLQLSFDLAAPPEPASGAPPSWFALSEVRDSSRHGAEVAALLVMLQPVESGFAPLLAEAAPPALEQAPPLPPPEPAASMPPPAVSLPPPDWLML
jgi:hypothetical protein